MPDQPNTEGTPQKTLLILPDPRRAFLLAIAGMRELQGRGEGGIWIARPEETER